MNGRPLPVAPLEAAIAAGRPNFTAADTAAVLGVTKRRVHELRRRGMSMWVADRHAIAAGFHPAEVWPDWIERVLEADREKLPKAQRPFSHPFRPHPCGPICRTCGFGPKRHEGEAA